MSYKKLVLVVVLIALSTSVLYAQVNFQHICTLNKPNSGINYQVTQLFDYNDDSIDEIITQYYNEDQYMQNIIITDLSGTIIDSIIVDDWLIYEEYRDYDKAILIKDGCNNILFRAKIDWDYYFIFLVFSLIDCESLSIIDSVVVYPVGTPLRDINLIDTYIYNGQRVFFVGAMEMSLMKEDSEENYLYKLIEDNDTLSYAGHFSDCGITNTHPNDSTLLSVGRHSYTTVGASAATGHCYYYLQKIDKDTPCNQTQLHTTSGTALWEWESKSRATYNHYPKNYDMITKNCDDDFSQVLQYCKLDSDDGNSVHFRSFDTTNWEELWSKTDTEIGMGDITASTCIEVNNEDNYVMYFRGDRLEIRDRITGNIIHHQDSTLAVCEILRKSNGKLLFFVEKDDETGYDVYSLDGPIFVSNDEPQEPNEFFIEQYPNPFKNQITFSFTSKEPIQNADVSIYNVKGQLVRELKIKNSKFKINEAVWNGCDEKGNTVSQGVYLYRTDINKQEISGKIIKMR